MLNEQDYFLLGSSYPTQSTLHPLSACARPLAFTMVGPCPPALPCLAATLSCQDIFHHHQYWFRPAATRARKFSVSPTFSRTASTMKTFNSLKASTKFERTGVFASFGCWTLVSRDQIDSFELNHYAKILITNIPDNLLTQ